MTPPIDVMNVRMKSTPTASAVFLVESTMVSFSYEAAQLSSKGLSTANRLLPATSVPRQLCFRSCGSAGCWSACWATLAIKSHHVMRLRVLRSPREFLGDHSCLSRAYESSRCRQRGEDRKHCLLYTSPSPRD